MQENKLNLLIVKFIGVGVLNTLFGYSIYAGFIFVGLPNVVSLLMATVAGVIFNYFSFGRMVFNARGGGWVFIRFIVVYSIVYLINAVLLSILTDGIYLNAFFLKAIQNLTNGAYSTEILTNGLKLNAYFAQGMCLVPSVILSWFFMNFWVYKKVK